MDTQDDDIHILLNSLSERSIDNFLCCVLSRIDVSYFNSHPSVAHALNGVITRVHANQTLLFDENSPPATSLSATSPATSRTGCKPNIERLCRIIRSIEDYSSSNKSSSNKSLWERINILQQEAPEDDPTKRHCRLEAALNIIDGEEALNVYRTRILNLLGGNERDITRKEYEKDTNAGPAEARVNKHFAERLKISVNTLKKRNTVYTRYVSMMRVFGPGSVEVMGNSKTHCTDWKNMTELELDILFAYILTYMKDWIMLAWSRNWSAAETLATTLLRIGMSASTVNKGLSTVTSIITCYIFVGQNNSISFRHAVCPEPKLSPEPHGIIEELHTKLRKPVSNDEAVRTRKRPTKNNEDTIRSKRRREDPSLPSRTGTGSDTIDDDPTGTLIHDRRIAHHSSVQAERAPDHSANAAGNANPMAESISEVDGGRDMLFSEANSLTDHSASGEASNHWISSTASGCNSQFWPVNNEPSAEQAASLLFAFRNPQPASVFPTHQAAVPQDPESLRHPDQYSQRSEPNQDYAYAQLPVTATSQPEHHLDASNSTQFQPIVQKSPTLTSQPENRALQELSAPHRSSNPDSNHLTVPHHFYTSAPVSNGHLTLGRAEVASMEIHDLGNGGSDSQNDIDSTACSTLSQQFIPPHTQSFSAYPPQYVNPADSILHTQSFSAYPPQYVNPADSVLHTQSFSIYPPQYVNPTDTVLQQTLISSTT